jgi:putative glutamine amidotransferase
MSRRPILGVICCNRSVGAETAQAVMSRYIESLGRHADAALILIPSIPEHQSAHEIAPIIDGLLLTGSPSNVAPARYGDDAPGEAPFDERRDAKAMSLVDALIEAKKPIFGICRGFQELNVAFGGSLRRDVGNRDPIAHHAPDDAPWDDMFEWAHPVHLSEDGVLARAHGATTLSVNSVHYQGVDRLGDGLSMEARAPDGLVEAFSAEPNGAPILAVQWHPEWRPESDHHRRVYFSLLSQALRGASLADLRG